MGNPLARSLSTRASGAHALRLQGQSDSDGDNERRPDQHHDTDQRSKLDTALGFSIVCLINPVAMGHHRSSPGGLIQGAYASLLCPDLTRRLTGAQTERTAACKQTVAPIAGPPCDRVRRAPPHTAAWLTLWQCCCMLGLCCTATGSVVLRACGAVWHKQDRDRTIGEVDGDHRR